MLIKVDAEKKYHMTKSSGLCVSTGTGSTSWHKSINSVNPQIVQEILNLTNETRYFNTEEIMKICSLFNSSLCFDPSKCAGWQCDHKICTNFCFVF